MQVAELYSRNWTKYELAGFTGANVLRIMRSVEGVARQMRLEGVEAGMEVWKLREDM